MKCWIILFGLLGLGGMAQSQPLTVTYQARSYTARTQTVDFRGESIPIWAFSMQEKDYMILEQSVVVQLLQTLAKHKDSLRTCQKKLAVKDSLLNSYEKFEEAANRHIETQKEVIQKMDTLYLGYKGLYEDLKGVLGIGTKRISFMMNLGVVDPPAAGARPAAMVGLSVGPWLSHFQFARSFRGFYVGVRWP